MKHLALIAFFTVAVSYSSFGQDQDSTEEYLNNIQVAPIGLFFKAHVSYERTIAYHVTAGIGVQYYYMDLGVPEDLKIELFGRYYTGKDKQSYGFYVQPYLAGGAQLYNRDVRTFQSPQNITYGGGLTTGYKIYVLKKVLEYHLPVDFSLGVQVYPVPRDFVNSIEGLTWYFGGPGSILLARLSIGYAF
jgi:hypothetical protein